MVAAALFILGLKNLGSVRTARRGNVLAAAGMVLAVAVTFIDREVGNYAMILAAVATGSVVGVLLSRLVRMTAMPQMVALLNGFGGLASALVASSEFIRSGYALPAFTFVSSMAGVTIGTVTFAGSVIAFGKLQGIVSQKAVILPFQKILSGLLVAGIVGVGAWLMVPPAEPLLFWVLIAIAGVIGVLFVMPIGGADMPVVISFLNSLSGIAAAMAGFVLMNHILIVAGTFVGAAGLILTGIMCRAMNRSLRNVLMGGFGETAGAQDGKRGAYTAVKSCGAEEAAMIIENARLMIVVPGYGLAVSRAQHSVNELAKLLESRGTEVKYAIHPVAGRMPGHMNVLLAEADVPYEKLHEMDDINPEFEQADVALVIGANDVTNPVARTEKGSPIYGMPILDVDKAKSVIIIKRSLSPGYAGIKNPLFEQERTVMFFSDAKKALDQIAKELKGT